MKSLSPIYTSTLLAPLMFLSASAYAVEYLSVEQAQKTLFASASHFEAHFLAFDDQQK